MIPAWTICDPEDIILVPTPTYARFIYRGTHKEWDCNDDLKLLNNGWILTFVANIVFIKVYKEIWQRLKQVCICSLQGKRNLREKTNWIPYSRLLWVIRYFFIYSRHRENIIVIFFKAGKTFISVFHYKSLESIAADCGFLEENVSWIFTPLNCSKMTKKNTNLRHCFFSLNFLLILNLHSEG